jgi:hypothetical protein
MQLIITRLLVVAAGCFLSAAHAQIALYNHRETATWEGGGETLKQIVLGQYIFDLPTQSIVTIRAFPSSKAVYIYTQSELVLFAQGRKRSSIAVLGRADSWTDFNNRAPGVFLDYWSLVGRAGPTAPLYPGFSGPIFNTYIDYALGHEIRAGNVRLTLDRKRTRAYNTSGLTASEAATLVLARYLQRGYRLKD